MDFFTKELISSNSRLRAEASYQKSRGDRWENNYNQLARASKKQSEEMGWACAGCLAVGAVVGGLVTWALSD